jgi:transcriptional repressor of dcmA and dcmR
MVRNHYGALGGFFLEKLLNIKEAAEFLNVSEMTVRRWTNDGLLKCYRIGGRRARRFQQEDLLAYLKGNTALDISLGIKGFQVPDGSHVTHLSLDPDDSLDTALSFIVEGLANDETVSVVSPEAESKKIIEALQHRNVHADNLKKAGRLQFNHGMDTPAEQARYVTGVAGASEKRLRIFGDMTWAKEKGWPTNDLHALENMVNTSQTKGMLILCQYKLDRFSGEEALMALENHSHHYYKGALKENPFKHQH